MTEAPAARRRPLDPPAARVALAVGLLLAAALFWALLIRTVNHVAPAISVAMLIAGWIVPGALAWSAFYHMASLRARTRRRAALGATAAYLGLGLAYALAKRGGYFDGAPNEPVLWVTLLLMQDVCRLGLWPCSVG